MKTLSFPFIALSGWLLFAVIGGIDLSPSSGNQVDPAESLISAIEPNLRKVEGHLYLGDSLVHGIVVANIDDGTVWTPYVDGLRHGREIARFTDGSMKSDRKWIQGHREGEMRAWWPDGSIQEISHYEGDVLEGESKRWFADGQSASAFMYRAGQEDGSQIMWYEDGTIRANYVVIDGRRYGSNGTKGCTSTETSNE